MQAWRCHLQCNFAVRAEETKGRLFHEKESAYRSVYQRDRDRIIHSSSFRRLKHKTQVFVSHEGDHFRTRLTHSIEVAQIARTISSALGLNIDLTEAISLAHDLGHTPFGHSGEEALNSCMQPFGGFDHNTQAIKIVTKLERKYASFDGLNLSWETLEGIVKHNGPMKKLENYYLVEYNSRHDLNLETYPSCEAQVATISDDIAYNTHDLSDGLRANLFEISDLYHLPIVGECFRTVEKLHPTSDKSRLCHEAFRRLLGRMVEDVLFESRARLKPFLNENTDFIRNHNQPVIGFSSQFHQELLKIKKFLFERMYRHWKVNRLRYRSSLIIKELFRMFFDQADILPGEWGVLAKTDSETEKGRLICDYIAGMTDQYALMEYRKLTHDELEIN